MKKLFLWTFAVTLLCTWALAGAADNPSLTSKLSQAPQKVTKMSKEDQLARQQTLSATNTQPEQSSKKAPENEAIAGSAPELTTNVNPNPSPAVEKEKAAIQDEQKSARISAVQPSDYYEALEREKNEASQNWNRPKPLDGVRLEGGEDCNSPVVIPGVPYSDDGYTCDNNNDYDEVCPYNYPNSPDVVYSYSPAADIVITLDLCVGVTDYDTKLYVYQDNCPDPGNYYACNDDACVAPGGQSFVSKIECLPVYTGSTYYIVVDGYGYSADCGNYTLDISECTPCVVDCPDGSYMEQEACGEDLNGGCNWDPNDPPLEAIDCGMTVCGTCWADGGTRDTDWYVFTLDQTSVVTWHLEAEFYAQPIFFYSVTDCATYAYDYALVDPCTPYEFQYVLAAGSYWLWMGDQDFYDQPCGGDNDDYVFTLTCEPLDQPFACCYGDPTDPTCDDLLEADCLALGGVWHPGELCANFVCPAVPANDQCDGAIEVAVPSSTQGTTIDANPETLGLCGTSDGTGGAVWYKVTGTGNTITATTCNDYSDFDTKIRVWCGPCDALICVGGNDDSCTGYSGLLSTYSWCSAVGENYYILVHGFSSAEGNFQLDVDDDGVPCDNPPSCQPCVVECPPDSYMEQEACGDDTNGGCNTDPNDPPLEAIECGMTVCGTAWADASTRDTDWYTFTIDQTSIVTWTLEAEFFAQPIFFYSVTNCSSYSYDYALVDPCTPYSFQYVLSAGTYWLWMGDQNFAGNPCGGDNDDYVFTLTCETLDQPFACCYGPLDDPICEDLLEGACDDLGGTWHPGEYCDTFDCPVCIVDYSMTAPITDETGTNCGMNDDCALRAGEDVMYEVEIPEAGEWNFSLCGSDWDTYLFVGSSCCGSEVGSNDDYCGLQSQVTAYIAAGTYYVDIESYGSTSCGNYVLNVFMTEPCVVECPPDSYIEQEACGDDTNGGCNMTTPQFEDATCNGTICGTNWASGGTRDTDWYLLDITEPTEITLYGDAENPTYIAGIIPYAPDDPCNNSGFLDYYTLVGPCAPGQITFEVDGTVSPYVIWVGPNTFDGYACDGETDDYFVTITCVPIEPCPDNIVVEIMTDDYPGETTWDLVHVADGVVVGSGGPYSGQQTLYTTPVCVEDDPNGCYVFTIYDAYGDGICCDYGEGYYNVYDVDGGLVCTGGDFGSSESCTVGECAGACCTDGACEMIDPITCAGQGGTFYLGEDCATFDCPVFCVVQPPNQSNGIFSDPDCDFCGGIQILAENFAITEQETFAAITFWGGYYPNDQSTDPDDISVIFREDNAGVPGAEITSFMNVPADFKNQTGIMLFGVHEYIYIINFDPAVTLDPGTYHVELYLNTAGSTESWFWEVGDLDPNTGIAGQSYTFTIPEEPWTYDAATDMAYLLDCTPQGGGECDYTPGDCNCNGTPLELTDVVTMISQYRGLAEVCYTCPCPPHGDDFAPHADPNGNCVMLELSDVVTEIGAYRGQVQASGCGDCPPPGRLVPGGNGGTTVVPLKSKIKNIERSSGN